MESADTQYSILAVDDNTYTLRILEQTLQKADFKTYMAVSGKEGLDLIKEHGMPHLAIVDYHMPGMSGFEFCRVIHQFSDLPVIMLTAVGAEKTIIESLERYAEDYMVKPFSPGELVARVRRVLDRMGDFAFKLEAITHVDDNLKIDFPARKALIGAEKVSLTPTETKLLYILMRNAGETVTTEYIIRRLWPLEPAYEDRLHVHMHRLRRKIEHRSDSSAQYIRSERGTGYVFQPEAGKLGS